jgi:hypothetical protein
MKLRKYSAPFLWYPEDQGVERWNIWITLVLIFTSLVAPARVAFITIDSPNWVFINFMVDLFFFLDILVIFNTAIYDDNLFIIDTRKTIAAIYLKGWFVIDLLSIIPFDLVLQTSTGNNMNSMIKIVRIGRMYKLIKLTRLLKMLKLVKERSKIFKYINDLMKVGVGFERLFFFLVIFLMMSHIVSCLYVLTATVHDS